MMESQMKDALDNFVKEMKETEVCKRYYYQLGKIKKNPELFKKVNEYRQKNYEIQNTCQESELFEKMDAFEREYEKFRDNPIVDDFLRAELALCRMIQEINIFITDEIGFE
ncbi:MAG: YlbF family regulator [Lachnospiraceae bacterium]|jgi:cell fate (sporulation/competence/biofilm development) regulator YlbF (YheA/YmcA/DUF963 family)|nr:hypothetical protein C819_03229 [Lachnospiraceae bacterium 10-1]MCX4350223.1 YlbF family regulator [Lachnospiraceae bacterium]